ncbi:MAG: macrolide ABC transporter ATP-binding protein, partial [Fusobacteriaceae bacterium]
QQRGAVARSLINNPGIILADEPTGNLDTESTDQIVELLKKINKEFKTCVIIVTHNLEIAERSDRVIKLVDGKIVEDKRNNLN